MNNARNRICYSKRTYHSQSAAKRRVDEITDNKCMAYCCPICRHWHVRRLVLK